jgi:hypothetical protein
MATLSDYLHTKGIVLEDPLNEHQKKLQSVKSPQSRGVTFEESSASEVEEDSSIATNTEEDRVETMPKKGILKSKSSASPPDSPSDLKLSACTITSPIQSITGSLAYPMLSGRWNQFDHKKKIDYGYCLMRMYIGHPGIKETDFQFSWLDERTFVIRMKWPIFMQNSLFMSSLDTKDMVDENTNQTIEYEVYPEGHKVYDSMGKNSAKLEDDDGNIYTEGAFTFKRDMDTSEEKWTAEIFCTEVDADGNKGSILQIAFAEMVDDKKPFSSPIKMKAGGKLRLSKFYARGDGRHKRNRDDDSQPPVPPRPSPNGGGPALPTAPNLPPLPLPPTDKPTPQPNQDDEMSL